MGSIRHFCETALLVHIPVPPFVVIQTSGEMTGNRGRPRKFDCRNFELAVDSFRTLAAIGK